MIFTGINHIIIVLYTVLDFSYINYNNNFQLIQYLMEHSFYFFQKVKQPHPIHECRGLWLFVLVKKKDPILIEPFTFL